MNYATTTNTAPSLGEAMKLQLREVPEHTVLCREFDRSDEDPLALDPLAIEAFVSSAMKRFGRRGLALSEHGFYLQVDPLVLLLEGRFEGVKRTACIPLADGDSAHDVEDSMTLPPAQVLAFDIDDAMPLSIAVPSALRAAKAWALAADDRRLGGFVRLHVVPDRSAPSGAHTRLHIERLPVELGEG